MPQFVREILKLFWQLRIIVYLPQRALTLSTVVLLLLCHLHVKQRSSAKEMRSIIYRESLNSESKAIWILCQSSPPIFKIDKNNSFNNYKTISYQTLDLALSNRCLILSLMRTKWLNLLYIMSKLWWIKLLLIPLRLMLRFKVSQVPMQMTSIT